MAKLLDELKQRKPFRNTREEAILNVWRTGDYFAQQMRRILKPFGISQTQYNLLRILRGAGDEGLPCGEIGDRMLTSDPDITRLLDRLVRGKLARRVRPPRDRRVIIARITPAGLDLLRRVDPLISDMIDQSLGHMREYELKNLIALLEQMRHRVENSETAKSR